MSCSASALSSSADPAKLSRLAFAQGVLAALAFSVLLAGTNATTPLLPVYREVLAFSPLMLTLTFVSYVGVLVVVLLAFSRPSLVRMAPVMLCAALVLAMFADALLSTASEFGILTGRALAGVAGGIGTGSASALVVAALGARGRSVSATGNLVGAVAGTILSQTCVSLLAATAMRWTFVLHAVICMLVLFLLAPVLFLRRHAIRELLVVRKVDFADRSVLEAMADNEASLAVGCLSWAVLSLTIVLMPSYFADIGMDFVKTFGVIVLLVFSSLGQLLSPHLTRIAPWISGTVAIAVGAALILAGAIADLSSTAILGFVFLGAGTGIAYRLALVVLTKGAPPALQGAISSRYAAITYGAAAVSVLGSGLLGNLIGLRHTVIGVFVGSAAIALTLLVRAPKLRDAVE